MGNLVSPKAILDLLAAALAFIALLRLIFSRKDRTTCKTKIPSHSQVVRTFDNVGRTLAPSFINKPAIKENGTGRPYILVDLTVYTAEILQRFYRLFDMHVPFKRDSHDIYRTYYTGQREI